MRITPHSMAEATASQAAISIAIVISGPIRTSAVFSVSVYLTDSLVLRMFPTID